MVFGPHLQPSLGGGPKASPTPLEGVHISCSIDALSGEAWMLALCHVSMCSGVLVSSLQGSNEMASADAAATLHGQMRPGC